MLGHNSGPDSVRTSDSTRHCHSTSVPSNPPATSNATTTHRNFLRPLVRGINFTTCRQFPHTDPCPSNASFSCCHSPHAGHRPSINLICFI
jgi:hypothetical protein